VECGRKKGEGEGGGGEGKEGGKRGRDREREDRWGRAGGKGRVSKTKHRKIQGTPKLENSPKKRELVRSCIETVGITRKKGGSGAEFVEHNQNKLGTEVRSELEPIYNFELKVTRFQTSG